MTKHSTMIKIPLQLDAEQIGLLLGCMESIRDMGYLRDRYILMDRTDREIQEQITLYLDTIC